MASRCPADVSCTVSPPPSAVADAISPPEKLFFSYNYIHKICQEAAPKIKKNGKPDLIVAIGGGGFIPARILRTFLREEGEKNIPIHAIGLSLYEYKGKGKKGEGEEEEEEREEAGSQIIKTQWLDFSSLEKSFSSLKGKKILIVDEVDDTRSTLSFALDELYKDIEGEGEKQEEQEGEKEDDEAEEEEDEETARKLEEERVRNNKTKFSIFVLHNKLKEKRKKISKSKLNGGKYFKGKNIKDMWICYPWDSWDIEEQSRKAVDQGFC